MSSPAPTACALCSEPALQFAAPNFGRYAALRCNTCGEFVISHAAAVRIAGLPHQFKDAWRARIGSAAPEDILLLIVEPVGSGGDLKDTIVSRSSLSL